MDQKNRDTIMTTDYERIFHPQKLAIVGVSAEEGAGFGSGMFNALKAMGFAGEIFPVNSKGGRFYGTKISTGRSRIYP